MFRSILVRPGVPAALVCAWLAWGQPLVAQLPLEPPRGSGQSITPAYEGWFKNPDGGFTLLAGYFNRNLKETFDIPVGPNNRVEPGGPDMGQPTHFEPRRQWGVFAIRVPADFGDKKYTWTIVANGKAMSIPLGLTKGYQVEPYKDAAMGNTPPVLRFAPDGKPFTGPPLTTAATYTAIAGEPLTLTAWASDEGREEPQVSDAVGFPRPPRLSVSWAKCRGPGAVTFSKERPEIDKADGKTTATATFGAPGEYIIRLEANDETGEGGGGFQCCWTNAFVKVTVK